jgi:outer membrane protein
MNRTLVGLFALIALLVNGAFSSAEAQANRFGYINSQRILVEAPGTSDAQRLFEQDMERFRGELERMESELETLQENLERQQATLSAAVRQERQQEIQQRFIAYQTRRMELEETAQERQAELVGPIMERIMTVIEEIRIEGNYGMIFDAAAGALTAADRNLDLTEQVLQRLRVAGR